MRVLGLTGQAGAGKDFLCAFLSVADGVGKVQRVALADELKLELEEVLGLTQSSRNNVLWNKPYSPEVRWILQVYGTEYRRGQDPEYWVNRAEEHLEYLERKEAADLVVVTDVRYENEADMIRRQGGVVAEVWADPEVRAARLGLTLEQVQAQSQHASEVLDFEVDYRVENNHGPQLPLGLHAYLIGEEDLLDG